MESNNYELASVVNLRVITDARIKREVKNRKRKQWISGVRRRR